MQKAPAASDAIFCSNGGTNFRQKTKKKTKKKTNAKKQKENPAGKSSETFSGRQSEMKMLPGK